MFVYNYEEIIIPANSDWLQMRPEDDGTPNNSTQLFQGNNGVNIGKALTITPTIDIELKIVPTALFFQEPYNLTFADFDTITIDANEEFNVSSLDIWDMYIRPANNDEAGTARIFIVGTWNENRVNRP